MKVVTCVLALLCLWSCKKHSLSFIETEYSDSLNETATLECKMISFKDSPFFYNPSVTHTYAYANGRLSRWEVKEKGGTGRYYSFFYNLKGKIIYITTSDTVGINIKWKYTEGLLTEMEAIWKNGTPVEKRVFTYTNGKVKKVYRISYRDYVPSGYEEITWENGNIVAIKDYNNYNRLLYLYTFTYYTDKENKQRQLIPQSDMLFYWYYSWSKDLFAFMASKNLLKTATKKEGCYWSKLFEYQFNEKGFVTSIKNEKGTNEKCKFNFYYECNGVE